MNKVVLKTGLWSASICLISFIVWIISFTGIAIQSPLFHWTNIDGYIDFVEKNSQIFQYLAKSFMIVFSLSYMILTLVFSELIKDERKILVKIAIVFSVMFALVSSVHYFVQLSSVRFAITAKNYSGLEHFLQSNPVSFLSSVNMLGWTLFLGLSSLFMYLALIPEFAAKGIRTGLMVNSVSCLFGAIGYLFQIDLLTFACMNLGIGFGFIFITVSSIRFFRKIKPEMK